MTDIEIERRAKEYGGENFRARRTRTEQALLECNGEWTYNAFLKMVAESVPEQYRSSATVALSSGDYDAGGWFEVSYERLETDEELALRVRNAVAYAERSVQKERAQYERLKVRFEQSGAPTPDNGETDALSS